MLIKSLWIAFAGLAWANPPRPLTTLERGRLLYLLNCARCHGEEATGRGPDGAAFEIPPPTCAARLD